MASSGSDSDLPISPAGSGSSHGSPSSPASFPSSHSSTTSSSSSSSSSSMSFPSSTVTVASVADLLRELGCEGTSVEVKFMLATDSSVADAHKLWAMVTADGGGESELLNPDLLSNKEEAYCFVMNKLERIRRWMRKLDRKQVEVMDHVSKLKEVVNAGGPGAPAGFEPHRYGGLSARINITQVVDEEELKDHIETIRALLLQGSPASPGTDGDETVENCLDRESKEQLDLARFNLEYLELKSTALELLSRYLLDGIAKLEDRFLNQPTHLGGGSAEFVRFVDIPIYPKEAPPEGSRYFYG